MLNLPKIQKLFIPGMHMGCLENCNLLRTYKSTPQNQQRELCEIGLLALEKKSQQKYALLKEVGENIEKQRVEQ